MQKLYLKIKNRWWWFSAIIFLGWFLTKLLDYILNEIINKTKLFTDEISTLVNYQVPLSVILAYALSFFLVIMAYKLIQLYRVSKRDFKILKATYGKNELTIDITKELNGAVSNKSLVIVLSNNIAGDPCYGVSKIGKIKYQYCGKIFEKDYIEGELIVLPASSLTEPQIKSIIALLSSFGAEDMVIKGAEKALRGGN